MRSKTRLLGLYPVHLVHPCSNSSVPVPRGRQRNRKVKALLMGAVTQRSAAAKESCLKKKIFHDSYTDLHGCGARTAFPIRVNQGNPWSKNLSSHPFQPIVKLATPHHLFVKGKAWKQYTQIPIPRLRRTTLPSPPPRRPSLSRRRRWSNSDRPTRHRRPAEIRHRPSRRAILCRGRARRLAISSSSPQRR